MRIRNRRPNAPISFGYRRGCGVKVLGGFAVVLARDLWEWAMGSWEMANEVINCLRIGKCCFISHFLRCWEMKLWISLSAGYSG